MKGSLAMNDPKRIALIREWAAWESHRLNRYGTDEGGAAARKGNAILDQLGDLSESDWGVYRNAQREYASESCPS
jgi:hypothetical protein